MKKQTIFYLFLLTAFAITLNFLPHLNYPYPFHADEWVHFQYSNHLSSNAPLYFGGEVYSLEGGFHFLLATLNALGVSYLIMFTFFASILTGLICLGMFILTRRFFNETAALFSILFIALLNTTVAILGPAFLVPMSLGLFFITISLFLIKTNSNLWFLFFASILIIHPPTAVALFIFINIEFIFLKKDYLKNILLQALSFLIALPFYIPFFLEKGTDTINALSFTIISNAVFIPRFLGYVIIALVAIGIYFASERKKYSLIVSTFALLFFILLFYKFEIEFFIPYRRALMYLFMIFAVFFGVGCSSIIDLAKNKKTKVVLALILITIILIFSLPAKLNSNKYFYRVIDDQDYQAFLYIKENTPKDSIILLDPIKANALTPIAERVVFSRVPQGPNQEIEERNRQIAEFFEGNCQDLEFLKQNQIDIVYGPCENSTLENVYPNVYLVR